MEQFPAEADAVWVLGDGLTREVGPLAAAPEGTRVLLIEATGFARRHPYHPHKLTLLFAAMRHLARECEAAGHEVVTERAATFREGLSAYFERHPEETLVAMRPASGREAEAAALRAAVDDAGGELLLSRNESFICDPETFDEWAGDDDSYRHESFYRFLRRETGYLMDGDEPVGGAWNYDEENRETPPPGWEPPEPPRFEPDELTRETEAWVRETFSGGYEEPPYGGDWADPGPFRWPVTRTEARTALDAFVDDRLATFGDYQDAMVDGEWAMSHALLSPALNLGLLHPREVIEAALAAHEARDLPLNAVEGFLRQVLGWREFVRHVYRRSMPGLAQANDLGATEPLPEAYWTGDTRMACLADAVEGVRTRGYSHHIQRLMVLSNLGLLVGVDPAALNRWFHAAYVDAYHWVTTPNVVGMGLFASDVLSTKPYAASGNYVDRMGDYCDGCVYDVDETTGDGACPFNALYWDFLDRNEEKLRSNHRMGLVYGHLDRKSDAERAAIRERAATLRARFRDGEV